MPPAEGRAGRSTSPQPTSEVHQPLLEEARGHPGFLGGHHPTGRLGSPRGTPAAAPAQVTSWFWASTHRPSLGSTFPITRLRLRGGRLITPSDLVPVVTNGGWGAHGQPSACPILLSFSPASRCHSTSSFTCRLMALRSRLVPPQWIAPRGLFRLETGGRAPLSSPFSPDITKEHFCCRPEPAVFSAAAGALTHCKTRRQRLLV